MHGPREEVGEVPGGPDSPCKSQVLLGISNCVRPPPLENVGPPFEPKITFLASLWNTMKAYQICLA